MTTSITPGDWKDMKAAFHLIAQGNTSRMFRVRLAALAYNAEKLLEECNYDHPRRKFLGSFIDTAWTHLEDTATPFYGNMKG